MSTRVSTGAGKGDGRAGGSRKDGQLTFRSPKDVCGGPPLTPGALHAWLERMLSVRIGRQAIIPGHDAPFEYLCHAFFEGRALSEEPGAPRAAARAPDCVVWANRGGGKTWLGALATLLDLLFKPGIQVRILGGSLEQSLRMRSALNGFFGHGLLAEIRREVTARRITIFHDEEGRVRSVVEVLAASQTSVRGTRVQKLRCDEVDLFDPEVWEAAQLVTRAMEFRGPWGSTVRGAVEALSTMHRPYGLMWSLIGPDGPSRPTYRWGALDVLEHCSDEHRCATCLLHPECQGRAKTAITALTGGHVAIADAVGQKARVDAETWETEMLCVRPRRGDTVYPEFDAATHVVGDEATTDRPFERFFGGMDFGYRSEGALLLAGERKDGTIVVLREFVRKGVVLADYIARLKGWFAEGVADRGRFEFLGVDPAGGAESEQSGKSNIELLRDAGFRVKARGSEIRAGIRAVRGYIAPVRMPGAGASRPGLLVHRSCTRLIECLTRYRYNPDRPEDLTPMKEGNDHAPDALRYMIVNLAGRAGVSVSWY